MKFIILALLVASAFANMHPVNHELVAELKEKATWEVMEPEENPFFYMPVEQIKAMMGTKLVIKENTIKPREGDIPVNFDAREVWGSKIHPIRDQGHCGSCWAFGATEALSDRFAIQTSTDVILSPQHLVSCNTVNYGCNGGYMEPAWMFMGYGITTEDCYPYTSGATGEMGRCQTKCKDGSDRKLYKGSSSIEYGDSVEDTQRALMTEGPVEAAFTVYQDFMNYKSGIYQYTSGKVLGGHAIKAIGWGTENGVDYWLMANSWGTSWGDKGFFKIKRGECSVDTQMTFALAREE